MKTLFLLRHAKSSWDNPALEDFDRPLNKRGKRAAKAIGAFIGKQQLKPELVLCSSAKRARDTLSLVEKGSQTSWPTEFEDTLYLAGPGKLFSHLMALEEAVSSVMMIGHNPGFHELALTLAGDGGGELSVKYPTAALAVFDSPAQKWDAVTPENWCLQLFVCPRDLEN
jgi:phosphohistidine phosphatase